MLVLGSLCCVCFWWSCCWFFCVVCGCVFWWYCFWCCYFSCRVFFLAGCVRVLCLGDLWKCVVVWICVLIGWLVCCLWLFYVWLDLRLFCVFVLGFWCVWFGGVRGCVCVLIVFLGWRVWWGNCWYWYWVWLCGWLWYCVLWWWVWEWCCCVYVGCVVWLSCFFVVGLGLVVVWCSFWCVGLCWLICYFVFSWWWSYFGVNFCVWFCLLWDCFLLVICVCWLFLIGFRGFLLVGILLLKWGWLRWRVVKRCGWINGNVSFLVSGWCLVFLVRVVRLRIWWLRGRW